MSTIQSNYSNTPYNDELVGHVVAAGGVTALTSTGSVGISGISDTSPMTLIEPKFNYLTFNVTNSAQTTSMVSINPQVNIFKLVNL